MLSKLTGLTCLVTGGAGSLGLATSQHLINQGFKIILCDLPSTNGHLLAEGINKQRCFFHPTDVTSEADLTAAINFAKSKFGQLNVLINCAGISSTIKVYNHVKQRPVKLELIDRILAVNCTGTFNAIRLACEAFALNEPDTNGQRGLIINTSSVSAYDGQAGQSIYAASNGAVNAMTLPVARDLASMGVRVVTIAPGYFESPLISDDPVSREFLKSCPLLPKRFGIPEEFADMVQSVIENPMLNGEVIR